MARAPTLDEVDGVIHAFYDAALEPARWQDALDRLGDLLGGCAIGTSIQSQSFGPRYLGYSRLDPFYMSIMAERYPTARANPMVAAMERLPAAKALAREAVMQDHEYFSSAFYADVFRPQGIAHAAVACAHRSADLFIPLGIFRRSSQKEFGATEHSALSIVLPHLDKALRIYVKIGMAEASRSAVENGLDRLPFGILFLDLKREVWRLNEAAEAIIRKGDGLSLRHRRLHTCLPSEDRRLQSLIASALAFASGSAAGAGGLLAVSRPSMATPLSVLVAPLPAGTDMADARPGAIVFVSDPVRRALPCADALGDLFKLTHREASVASLLAAGLSVEEAAIRLKMTVGTARVHLKRIFAKTEVTRQADLVRLVLTSVAALGINGGSPDNQENAAGASAPG